MKRLISLLLVTALLLAACGSPSADRLQSTGNTEDTAVLNPPEERPEPTQESFGLAYVPSYGFNPYHCNCITNRPVISLVYEGLFVLSSSFQPEPVLCEQFSVSESGKNYVFRLCEGITFSDGTLLTAEDVVASLEAARGSEYYGSRFSKVASFSAADSRTVKIDLHTPYENLPLLLDVPIVKAGTTGESMPLGSGPYAFSGEGAELHLIRSPGWWQDKTPPIDSRSIPLTACDNPSEIRDSFEFGSTSLVCADLNAPTAVGYRCDYELWDCPTTTMQYLGFNLGYGMFVSRDFRSAVTHIIDRDSIISSIFKGFAEPAYLPCTPLSPLYDAELAANYQYDPQAFAAAREEAASTFHEDYTATLLVCSADPSRVEMAYRIVDAMQAMNLKIEVKSVDYDSYQYRLQAGQFDMFIGEARLSANFDLSEFFRSYGALSYGGLASGSMEKLCRDALENSGNCYDLQKSVMDNGYFCPILFKSYAVMANRGAITNLQPAVDSVFHLSGGRTLAEASASYESMTAPPEEVTEPPESTEETENTDE